MKKREWVRLLMICMLAVVLVIGMNACGNKSDSGQEATDTEQAAATEEAQADTDQKDEMIGEAAADFEAELADGTTFSLSDAKGKVVLLNFWATWCEPCKEEMPAIQKVYDDYMPSEVQVVAVDCAETKNEVDTFLDDAGYTFPVAYDEDETIGSLSPSRAIPFTVIIDQEGNIAETFVGSHGADAQYEAFTAAIEKLLGD